MKRGISAIIILILGIYSLSYSQSFNIQWEKSLGGSLNDAAFSITQTDDGGYIVVGNSHSNDGDLTTNHGEDDYWVVKLDSIGNKLWQKSLGGSLSDVAPSVIQTDDGGFIVAGTSTSNDGDVIGNHGYGDFWIVKLSDLGIFLWQKTLGGSSGESAFSIIQAKDGGYVIVGESMSINGNVTVNHGITDYWVVKLDSLSNLLWQKSFGGSGEERAYSLAHTNDGGYLIVGYSTSDDGDVSSNYGAQDYWLIKIDDSGNLIWQKSFGGSSSDIAHSVTQTSDGGYIVVGSSHSDDGDVSNNHGGSDYWVVKINSLGNKLWQKTFGGSFSDGAKSIIQTNNNEYVIAGFSSSNDGNVSMNHGATDIWIIKIDSLGIILEQKSLGGTYSDWAYSIKQTNDSGFVVAGISNSIDGDVSGNHGADDCWVVKLGDNTVYTTTQFINSDIKVYPNPARDKVFVFSNDDFILELYNFLGEKLIVSEKDEMDISKLSSGVYLILIKDKNRELLKVVRLIVR